MPKCDKCGKFLPPGFVEPVPDTEDKLCLFCRRDIKQLEHYGEIVTKEQIIKEYDIALKMIKEENEILKKYKVEKLPKVVL